MKFDVIIGNPPYALDTAGAGRQAKPIYNLFVQQAKKLQPHFLSMIIPSRWFSGGMGLDDFRSEMMNDRHITTIVDYTNSKDCFPGISVSGGVCYFLWDRENNDSNCEFVNITNNQKDVLIRPLNEFQTLVRYNKAVSIIHKIRSKREHILDEIISSLMPFGLSTSYRGHDTKNGENDLTLFSSNGITYIDRSEIIKGNEMVDSFKILISKTGAEHAGEPGKDGKFRVIPSSIKVLSPGDVCTHSYFLIGNWNSRTIAENALSYVKTRFVRFLMLLCVSGFGLSKLVFQFVPMQDFSKPWTDEELYAKYGLTEDEIAFLNQIDSEVEQTYNTLQFTDLPGGGVLTRCDKHSTEVGIRIQDSEKYNYWINIYNNKRENKIGLMFRGYNPNISFDKFARKIEIHVPGSNMGGHGLSCGGKADNETDAMRMVAMSIPYIQQQIDGTFVQDEEMLSKPDEI